MIVLTLNGCLTFGGAPKIVIDPKEIVPCPKTPPKEICEYGTPGTLSETDAFLALCREENAYWRESWRGCKEDIDDE